MRIKPTFLGVTAGLAILAASPAFAVTTPRHHVHRVHMTPYVTRTAAPPSYVDPGYYNPGYDDPAFDSPWDPFFGHQRTPASGELS